MAGAGAVRGPLLPLPRRPVARLREADAGGEEEADGTDERAPVRDHRVDRRPGRRDERRDHRLVGKSC